MSKINWKNDLILTRDGEPGKVLVVISAVLWCIASVLFAACAHARFLEAAIQGNPIYEWLDKFPALPIAIALTVAALGLLSFKAVQISMAKKRRSISTAYDKAKTTHWKNDVYREVKKIASPTSNIFFYQMNDDYCQANASLNFCIEALSFGKITIEDLPEEGASLKEWKTNLDLEKQHIKDLCTIWNAGLAGLVIHLGIYDTRSPNKIRGMGRALGIDNMVDAYFAGVPLEDIIA